jgi:hypothetical protein
LATSSHCPIAAATVITDLGLPVLVDLVLEPGQRLLGLVAAGCLAQVLQAAGERSRPT